MGAKDLLAILHPLEPLVPIIGLFFVGALAMGWRRGRDWPFAERLLLFISFAFLFPLFIFAIPALLRIKRIHPITRAYLKLIITFLFAPLPIGLLILAASLEMSLRGAQGTQFDLLLHPWVRPWFFGFVYLFGFPTFFFLASIYLSPFGYPPFLAMRSKFLEERLDGSKPERWDRFNFLCAYAAWMLPLGWLYGLAFWRSIRKEVRMHCIEAAAVQIVGAALIYYAMRTNLVMSSDFWLWFRVLGPLFVLVVTFAYSFAATAFSAPPFPTLGWFARLAGGVWMMIPDIGDTFKAYVSMMTTTFFWPLKNLARFLVRGFSRGMKWTPEDEKLLPKFKKW